MDSVNTTMLALTLTMQAFQLITWFVQHLKTSKCCNCEVDMIPETATDNPKPSISKV